MAYHGFCGVDLHFICVLAQRQLDGHCLKKVIVVGAGSVGIYIVNLLRHNPGIVHRKFHCFSRSASVFRRGCDMVGIAGSAVSHKLRKNLCASVLRMLQRFKNHNAGTFSHYKAVTVFVEGSGSRLRILIA